MRQNRDQYMVRFPEGMRDLIKQRAKERGRTMNAEIVFHLRKAVEEAAGAVVGAETPAAVKVQEQNHSEASSHAAD